MNEKQTEEQICVRFVGLGNDVQVIWPALGDTEGESGIFEVLPKNTYQCCQTGSLKFFNAESPEGLDFRKFKC